MKIIKDFTEDWLVNLTKALIDNGGQAYRAGKLSGPKLYAFCRWDWFEMQGLRPERILLYIKKKYKRNKNK